MGMTPNQRETSNEGLYFLFFLLPHWEEFGTVCHFCWPSESDYDDPCRCPRPWTVTES